MNRRSARESLLRLLYQREFVETSLDEALSGIDPGRQRTYMEQVLSLLRAHQPEIDAQIAGRAVGWRLERLALMDRNILRLGICELLYVSEIPPEVAIDEAVELAKRYGTEQAPVFINGILDRIWKDAELSVNLEEKTD
jgi:N utilization substance protein B